MLVRTCAYHGKDAKVGRLVEQTAQLGAYLRFIGCSLRYYLMNF
jgi:hypothetical protein